MAEVIKQPPVLLLSHGTTMLTGEQSNVRGYWEYHGEKALRYPVKGVIIMVSFMVSNASDDSVDLMLACRGHTGTLKAARFVWLPTPTRERNL